MSSSKDMEIEENVVFDDDTSCFSPAEAEYTVAKLEPVFSMARLWNAILWFSLGFSALSFGVYHSWLMFNVHQAQTNFPEITDKKGRLKQARDAPPRERLDKLAFLRPVKPLITTYRLLLVSVASISGFIYFEYLMQKLSEIRDLGPVEREISFRTECGFYYSFYKQLVNAPTLMQGLRMLTEESTSEHPTPVNALARFNIHPEVILAFLYRNFGSKTEDPIFFYTYWVWFLQGVQVFSLFILAAVVCRSVIGGFLSTLMFSHIRPFATRAFFTVSLRENFSMPFFWLRLVFLTLLFRSHLSGREKKFCLLALAFSTFAFSTTWQLSPFLLFAQGLPLYGGAMLNAIEMDTVESVLLSDAAVIFVVGLLHFAYPLFLSSPAITCAVIIVLSNRFYPPAAASQRKFFRVLIRCILVVLAALFTSGAIKSFLGVADDNHVFKLFLAKVNLGYEHDFDVNMYLSSSVFRAQAPSFFIDLSFGAFLLYPVYACTHIIFLLGILKVFEETTSNRPLTEYEASKKDLNKKQAEALRPEPSLLAMLLLRRPELSMHALVVTPMAFLGVFIQRLQLLWTPHMCVFYAWVLTTPAIYTLLPLPTAIRRWVPRVMRYVLPILVMAYICSGYIPAIRYELAPQTRVTFHDPDTVQLMDWIANKSRPTGVFTGSMQLMSAVRLSTGRAITNHPHYENLDMRERTRILYQAYYGRSKVADAYKVLRDQFGVDYIVLEHSICFAPNEGHPFAAFRMVDMLDAANGEQPEMGPFAGDPRLRAPEDPEKPRRIKPFCEVVAPDKDESLTHVVDAGLAAASSKHPKFARVFKNPTFYIYELLQ